MTNDRTQPERQRRYRAKLKADRERLRELEALQARGETAVVKQPKTTASFLTLDPNGSADRLIHPEKIFLSGEGKYIIDTDARDAEAIIGGRRFTFEFDCDDVLYRNRRKDIDGYEDEESGWPRVMANRGSPFAQDWWPIWEAAGGRIQALLDALAWERLTEGERAKRKAWLKEEDDRRKERNAPVVKRASKRSPEPTPVVKQPEPATADRITFKHKPYGKYCDWNGVAEVGGLEYQFSFDKKRGTLTGRVFPAEGRHYSDERGAQAEAATPIIEALLQADYERRAAKRAKRKGKA